MAYIDEVVSGGTVYGILQSAAYPGADLTAVHAAEIGSDPWAWIKSRIQAGNFSGIHVGDWIPFTADGRTYHAQIAGIDTYLGYGDTEVGHHIDFITQELLTEGHGFNKVNYNNGTSGDASPWLASDLYHWLNSLSGNVPNAAAADPATVAVDYTSTGVYDKLPAALQAVIAEKRLYTETRYTAGSLLTSSNSAGWASLGKLWLPTETEVCGFPAFGTLTQSSRGSMGQYPLFARTSARIKTRSGSRSYWWLLNAAEGDNKSFCRIDRYGFVSTTNASTATIYAPICFRIA